MQRPCCPSGASPRCPLPFLPGTVSRAAVQKATCVRPTGSSRARLQGTVLGGLHAACRTRSASQRRGDSRQLITYPSTIYLQHSSKLPNDGKMLVIFGHMCFSPKMGQSQMAQQ